MAMRPACIVAACVAALWASETTLSAQTRFEILGQDTMTNVSGLRIVTIRDNQLSACYTLFVMQSSVAPAEEAVAAPTPADEAIRQSVQRIREAADKRDRQVAELMSTTSTPGQFETARVKIEEEYERALMAELPGSHPWASALPGVKSGAPEDSASAIRRAMLDPDPTSSMKAMADRLARLEDLLTRLIEEPRLAVSGPVACAPW